MTFVTTVSFIYLFVHENTLECMDICYELLKENKGKLGMAHIDHIETLG